MSGVPSRERFISGWRVILALVTAIFFLLCHGILGASHALGHSGIPTDGANSHEMPMEKHGSEHGFATPSNDGTSHTGDSHTDGSGLVYAAVIAVSAFGALLFFALAFVRRILTLSLLIAKRTIHVLCRATAPCRGPTLARLQVFRL